MIRITCDSHDEADAIWQQLHTADTTAPITAQLWVCDALVAQLRFGSDGRLALHAAPPARTR